jgi:hypothetical protein
MNRGFAALLGVLACLGVVGGGLYYIAADPRTVMYLFDIFHLAIVLGVLGSAGVGAGMFVFILTARQRPG